MLSVSIPLYAILEAHYEGANIRLRQVTTLPVRCLQFSFGRRAVNRGLIRPSRAVFTNVRKKTITPEPLKLKL